MKKGRYICEGFIRNIIKRSYMISCSHKFQILNFCHKLHTKKENEKKRIIEIIIFLEFFIFFYLAEWYTTVLQEIISRQNSVTPDIAQSSTGKTILVPHTSR